MYNMTSYNSFLAWEKVCYGMNYILVSNPTLADYEDCYERFYLGLCSTNNRHFNHPAIYLISRYLSFNNN